MNKVKKSFFKFFIISILFFLLTINFVFGWIVDNYLFSNIVFNQYEQNPTLEIKYFENNTWVNKPLEISLGSVNDYSVLPSNYINYYRIKVIEEKSNYIVLVNYVNIYIYDTSNNLLNYEIDYLDINCFEFYYYNSYDILNINQINFTLENNTLKSSMYLYLKIEMKLNETQNLYKMIHEMPYIIKFKINLKIEVRTCYES